MAAQKTLLYVLGLKPEKIGGMELFMIAFAKRLQVAQWRVIFCCEGEPSQAVRDALRIPNVVWEYYPNQAGFSLRHAGQCAALVRKYKPSVLIYAFNGVLRPYPWVARLFGIRRIFYNDHTSRGFPVRKSNVLKVALGRLITFPLTASICVSEYVRRCELAEQFVAPDRIQTVYNGIDLSGVSAAAGSGKRFREQYGIGLDKKVVLQVSWMVAVKGVDKLLRAAQIVLAAVPDAHFVLVGEGADRATYQALSEELGIAKSVTWTGMVKNPLADGVFEAADICCLFSQWQEACPLAVLEAMAFGVPVICSNTGGLPDLVVDGNTGYVVDRDDIAGLAEKITKLLENSELRSELGVNARAWVARRFDLARMADEYVTHLLA